MIIPPKITRFVRTNLLTILTAASVIFSLLSGILIREKHNDFDATFTPRKVEVIKFLGDLFLQMLKSLVMPLIASSLICALGNLNAKMNKFIGGYGVLYYLTTTLLAIFLGIILVMSIRPGEQYNRDEPSDETDTIRTNSIEKIMDLVRNMFPENPVQAALEQYKTELLEPTDPTKVNDPDYWRPTGTYEKSMNILGIVMMSIFIGIAISQINSSKDKAHEKAKKAVANGEILTVESGDNDSVELKGITTKLDDSENTEGPSKKEDSIETSKRDQDTNEYSAQEQSIFLKFINEANEVFMKLVGWVIWLSPVGIFFLILGKLLETGDIWTMMSSLSLYAACVLGGIFIHALIVLPLIYFALCRQNPFKVIKGMTQALVTAFGTSSSSATLPVTMRCLTEMGANDPSMKIDSRVVNFIVPVGATINMDGTALYEAVAAIFISQVNNIEMTPLTIVVVVLTATLGSVGAAGIPQAGLITLIIVLDTLGLPIEDISIILTIDWFLDRFRTVVNVLGDSFGCVIISKRANFEELDGKTNQD